MTTIQFTPEKATALQKAYDRAVGEGAEVFVFEGQEVVVAYAKYLLEYLKTKGVMR